MVSHPETGSDSPIGSDLYRGRDIYPLRHNSWKGRIYPSEWSDLFHA